MAAHHAIDALTRLGKDQFFYPSRTLPAGEAIRMIALVAGHDGFLGDGQLAHVTLVRAGRAHRVPIRQEQEVRVGRHSVVTFDATETVDVPQRFAGKDDLGLRAGQMKSRWYRDAKRRNVMSVSF